MSSTRVLVVDDDPQMADLLATVLTLAGYTVTTADTVSRARAELSHNPPDLALVDLGLPDGSGQDLVRHIASRHPDVCVIIVTASEQEDEHVRGLLTGADDVVPKPFRVSNLMARVEAVLRRRNPTSPSDVISVGSLTLDLEAVTASRAGETLDLTATEFRLLVCLARNRGRVVSKSQLLADVWGYDFGGDGAVVERFVSTLRRKLGQPDLVHTVRGFGYTVKADAP